jgi:hypothetical protein
MRIVDLYRGGGGTGIVPVILQKFNSQNTAASPFRASLAAPRCFGKSTIAGSLLIWRSHKLILVPHTERCTCNAPTARIIANDSSSHLHKFG